MERSWTAVCQKCGTTKTIMGPKDTAEAGLVFAGWRQVEGLPLCGGCESRCNGCGVRGLPLTACIPRHGADRHTRVEQFCPKCFGSATAPGGGPEFERVPSPLEGCEFVYEGEYDDVARIFLNTLEGKRIRVYECRGPEKGGR